MGRGLSELQKHALTTAITDHKSNRHDRWGKPILTEEQIEERHAEARELFSRFIGAAANPPRHVNPESIYYVTPYELVNSYYATRNRTNAQQVGASKALARLVQRGLLTRDSHCGQPHYYLTTEGEAKAVALLTNG